MTTTAEIILPSQDLHEELPFYTKKLGFRLETIFPADNPAVAVLSGHGMRIRLDKSSKAEAGQLRIACDDPESFANGDLTLTAPNGTKVEIAETKPKLLIPPTEHNLIVRKNLDNQPWVIGRAGMNYRDMIPGRLGGAIIASHIRIPEGGPVPDMVHYHTIGFQLIYCKKGWVRLVYEDQGPEFILKAGDCVTQPPEIRHRVLEASEGLEVIEIGVPAEHITTIDHDMELPTGRFLPDRDYGGQKFCRHQLEKASWNNWIEDNFELRETGISETSAGEASVQVIRVSHQLENRDNDEATTSSSWLSHDSDIHFSFILQGSMSLDLEGDELRELKAEEAFVIPPSQKFKLSNCSMDLEILQISLPAKFRITVHAD